MSDMEMDFVDPDGGIFLSEKHPGKCLKRWFEKDLHNMESTIEFFHFCTTLVESLNLSHQVLVPTIYEKHGDFVMMDYDPSAIAIAEKTLRKENEAILELLLKACLAKGEIQESEYAHSLAFMIQDKSMFIRESFQGGKLVIAGLELH